MNSTVNHPLIGQLVFVWNQSIGGKIILEGKATVLRVLKDFWDDDGIAFCRVDFNIDNHGKHPITPTGFLEKRSYSQIYDRWISKVNFNTEERS